MRVFIRSLVLVGLLHCAGDGVGGDSGGVRQFGATDAATTDEAPPRALGVAGAESRVDVPGRHTLPRGKPGRCVPMRINHEGDPVNGTDVMGFTCDEYRWQDSRCRWRSAALVRNDETDPAKRGGGYLRRFRYQTRSGTRTCSGGNGLQPGFGYTVNHYGGKVSSSREHLGRYRRLFVGEHHALHEFTWVQDIDYQDVDVTVQWLFSTGRDHPLWAVTFDSSKVAANTIRADSRSPYGEMHYDGDEHYVDGGEGNAVAGVGWGDRYRFRSLGSILSRASAWDYREKNVVPYVLSFTSAVDAEMGLVQTQTHAQHDAGGFWLYRSWGKRSAGPMPANHNWTYQLNQYELSGTTRSKRLAWGTNYGAVGQVRYDGYGNDSIQRGYPYQNYSVAIIFGEHSAAPTAAEVRRIEALQRTVLLASVGEVAGSGPAGIADPTMVLYRPHGYDPRYGAFRVRADHNRLKLEVYPGVASAGQSMLFIFDHVSDEQSRVTLTNLDEEYYVSYRAEAHEIWVTLSVVGSTPFGLELAPSAADAATQ